MPIVIIAVAAVFFATALLCSRSNARARTEVQAADAAAIQYQLEQTYADTYFDDDFNNSYICRRRH